MSQVDPVTPALRCPTRQGIPALVRMAALAGVEQTIRHFLSRGGAPDSTDDEGRSLLQLAASRGHVGICRLLLDAGASPGMFNGSGGDLPAGTIRSGPAGVDRLIEGCLESTPLQADPSCFDSILEESIPPPTAPPGMPPGSTETGTKSQQGDDQPCAENDGSLVLFLLEDGEVLSGSSWVAEEERPLPGLRDESCQSSAEHVHRRITRHRAIDRDEDWSDIEIVLPVVRRGSIRFSTVGDGLLVWIARMLEHGSQNGWIPSQWLSDAVTDLEEERDRADLCLRLEMLLGEHGIQLEDSPLWLDIPLEETETGAADVSAEILSFLDDLGPGSRDPLLPYFRDLSYLSLLDWDKERMLGQLWQEEHDLRGLQGLVEGNLRFVVREARKFQGLGLDIQDLVSDGNLGLIEAAKRFDPARENRFLTYASWWIRQSIFHALAEQGGQFRLPQKVAGNAVQLNRIIDRMADDLGREPSLEEIAAEGTFSGRELDRLYAIRRSAVLMASGDDDAGWRPEDDQIPCLADGPEDRLDIAEFSEQLWKALDGLNSKEREIISRHFGLLDCEAETLEAIGQSMTPPISRERVRQIEERALSRVRDRRRSLLEPYLGEPTHPWSRSYPCRRPLQEDDDGIE